MGSVELIRTMAGTPERVFSVVGDLPAYGQHLPLTRVEHDPGPVGLGWRFTGLSGVGPLVVVDRMRVTEWDPPHGFAVEKLGPVLDGGARATLRPEGAATRVVWQEEITVRPARLGRHLGWATDPFTRWLFGRALDRMAARTARG